MSSIDTEISSNASDEEDRFYSDAEQYWSEVPATIDGMLGGFGFISETDIKGSRLFLKQLFNSKTPPGKEYALDCGAGIGRISKHLLTSFFGKVDLVEQNPAFLQEARQYIGLKQQSKIGNYFSSGLQDFRPEENKYDVIWIQWVLGHLKDEDLIDFLLSCQSGLKTNGVIAVKENITSTCEPEEDEIDSSVTRPIGRFREIFSKAGLECFRQMKQQHFPKGLFSVYMFALKPKKEESECGNQHSEENVEKVEESSPALCDT